MSTRLYIPNQQSFSNLGAIGAGHKLYTYETGTTTPKSTFSDTALSVANTNPIIADSAGRFGNIFVSDLSQYKIILKDENDNILYQSDPVDPKSFTLTDFDPQPLGYLGTTAGTSTAYLLNPFVDINSYTNKLIFALDFHTACGADATINIYDASGNLIGSKNLKVIVNGVKRNVSANDISASRYILSYDGSDFIVINNSVLGLTGEIKAWASSSMPSGYLECNGAEVAISSYGNLSTAIYVGNSNNADTDLVFGYKTDGSGTRSTSGTHIKLPDLRGEFIRGWDNSRGIDSSRKLGSYQDHSLETHRHAQSESITLETPNGVYNVNGQTINGTTYGTSNQSGAAGFSSNTSSVPLPSVNGGTVNISNETRPRNISLMYIIKT